MSIGQFLDCVYPLSYRIQIYDSSESCLIYSGFKPTIALRHRVFHRFYVQVVPDSCNLVVFCFIV